MRILVMVVVGLGWMTVGCSEEPTTCAACNSSFTDAQCDEIAKANACTGGRAYQDTVCSPPTQGCEFDGCPTGKSIMCTPPN